MENIEDADLFAAALEDLNLAWDEKIEGLAALADEDETEAEGYEAKAKAWLQVAATRRKKAQWYKDYICQEMTARGVDKAGKLIKVSRVPSPPSCNILDLEVLPDAYIRHIPARFEPDKKAIIERWREFGEQLPGTEVSQGCHIRIWP